MKVLSIDIETFSNYKIGDVGVFKYADDPDFKILLFGYSVDGGEVSVVDLTREKLPQEIESMLTDEEVLKTAFNAQFERTCIDREFNIESGPWECSMVKAWSCGIGGGLEAVGGGLGLSEEEGKIKDGKRLIKKFCTPNPDPYEGEDWQKFIDYCKRDVEVELVIRDKLSVFKTPDFEREIYELDQQINRRGVLIDSRLVDGAIAIDDQLVDEMTAKYTALTGLDNPNSLKDIKEYIESLTGDEVKSLTKATLDLLIEKYREFPEVVEVLKIRKILSKSSTAKYHKMEEVTMRDGRVRGIFQFYGASRTGRWAGRLIQPQNLPRNYIPDLDTARALIYSQDLEAFEMAYDDPPDILSQCLRTAIIPSEGMKFAVADFSAIEARVVAWFAGEDWVLKAFEGGEDIYCTTASKMFGVPVEKHGVNGHLRQKGKIATLACGYQGSVGALKAMGADRMGLPESELQDIVDKWRETNSRIKDFWYETQNAVISAIKGQSVTFAGGKLHAIRDRGILWVTLPSGRRLAYAKPNLGTNRWGGESITFQERMRVGNTWKVRETYGGSLVENIVQATARDLLAESMLKLDRAGYKIVMHIHDEVVIEIPEGSKDLDRICTMMGETPRWAEGLPLEADGYECKYYMKD